MAALKNCGPKLSYTLAELFNRCLQESCFPDYRCSLCLRMLGKGVWQKNYRPSRVFEKLVNNRLVGHLEKCGLFSNFQYGFRSSQSNADLLTVVSDRIARGFNRSGATRAVAQVLWNFGLDV